MIYITGDCHGQIGKIKNWYKENSDCISNKDILILLGDSGINYRYPDIGIKEALSKIPIKYFVIHGNHDGNRPGMLKSYYKIEYKGAPAYSEFNYLNIKYADFGQIYSFNDNENKTKKVLVLDGAYSVDKWYRLRNNYGWWNDEQPTDKMKDDAIKNLEKNNWEVDYILSHTCPYNFEPKELFLNDLDQSTVDNSYEKWLQTIYDRLKYNNMWYFGHFHANKAINKKMVMLYNSIISFGNSI
jgi:predicted phosphodiesterase